MNLDLNRWTSMFPFQSHPKNMDGQSFGSQVFDVVSEAISRSRKELYGIPETYQTIVRPSPKSDELNRILSTRIEHGGAPFAEIFDGIFQPILAYPSLINKYVLGERRAEDVELLRITESPHQPDLPISISTTLINVYNLGKHLVSITGDIMVQTIHVFTPDTDIGPFLYRARLEPKSRTISPADPKFYAFSRRKIGSVADLYRERLKSGELKVEKYGPEITSALYEVLRNMDESELDKYFEYGFEGVLSVFYLYPFDVKIGDQISFKLHAGIRLVIF
ncbi:MAG: hypothetical protein QXM12_02840 [Nitrososphaerota archaeon]